MSALTPTAPPRPFHLLAKPTGAVCNLDCSYCFFLSKEMLYPGSRFRMADELLEAYVRQLIEAHGARPRCTIAWQGGEPTLMGVDFFRRSVELARGYLRPGQRAAYTIQTNGDAARRGVGRVLPRARLPRRHLDRRAARAARRVPRRQGRQGLVRPGHARARRTCRTRGVEWNVLTTRARGERRPRARGVPLPPRRAAARRSCSSSRSSSGSPRAPSRPEWSSWRDRPLYVQEGAAVTERSVTARAVRAVPDRRLRGVGAPRRRRGLRADVRRRARQLGRRAAGPLRPLRDLRRGARARAHRRPLLVRPLRRAGAQAREHLDDAHARPRRLAAAARSSGSPSATRCRSTASTATSASRATAAARRTASSRRPTASRA